MPDKPIIHTETGPYTKNIKVNSFFLPRNFAETGNGKNIRMIFDWINWLWKNTIANIIKFLTIEDIFRLPTYHKTYIIIIKLNQYHSNIETYQYMISKFNHLPLIFSFYLFLNINAYNHHFISIPFDNNDFDKFSYL